MKKRRPARAVPEAPARSFVVAVLGGDRVALPTDRVVEVARLDGCVPLPCEDPANLGVTFYRNQLVPLVDLAGAGARRGDVAHPRLCLMMRAAGEVVAVPVDEVCGVETAQDGGVPDGARLLDLTPLDTSSAPAEGR